MLHTHAGSVGILLYYYSTTFSPYYIAPGDYNGTDMNIDLDAGVGQPGLTRFCENIIINNDTLAEGDEFFTVSLASLNPLVMINPLFSSAEVQIVDDDGKLRLQSRQRGRGKEGRNHRAAYSTLAASKIAAPLHAPPPPHTHTHCITDHLIN